VGRIAQEILEAEQTLRRLALEKIRDTSQDPVQVQGARDDLARLPAIEQGEQQQNDRRHAGPLDAYRQRLKAATGDMTSSLEEVKVRGLDSIEDSFVGIITGTESVGAAFKRMAKSIIADLVRIAVQKLILSAIGGGDATVTTRASGGKVERRAGGGRIVGPGTGRSDSILAMIDGQKPLLVSNGESIVTAEATARYWPLIDAMNKGRLPRFADGGMLGDVPRLRAPSLPASLRGGGRRDRVELVGEIKVSPTPEFDARMERMSLRTVASAAEPIMSGAEARTIRRLKRPALPGAPI
jgi:hypothetical protein